ncbi:class I SAM-dependent RNA methyltransferase [Coralliovum pocilloporae]|uniref:class I SAM-dependent RNA methyltransferase n=1 Tax=Coralliovum pocilloporae TaxID=3066369 RepID=UPI003307396A
MTEKSGVTVRVDRLGHRGDGIASRDGQDIYVPFALPGEEVRVRLDGDRGHLDAVEQAHPQRQEPACPRFTECGGCLLQHLPDDLYTAFKTGLLTDALKARGITHQPESLVRAAPRQRRRAAFTARGLSSRVGFGYNGFKSSTLVEIEHCPVLTPALEAAIPGLKTLLSRLPLPKGPVKLQVLETESGLDVDIDGIVKDLSRGLRAEIDLEVKRLGWARLSINGEIVVEVTAPLLTMADTPVSPPPGGFTQATEEAEQVLAKLVLDGLGKSRNVADLYSGIGTFALRIARKAKTSAFEGHGGAVKALTRAARFGDRLKPLAVEQRDLTRRPLQVRELNKFDAIVLDPPRAGAKEQVRYLAQSDVPVVVMVSCNPATLARDLKTLLDGGYVLNRVVPVDQFLWSPHLETVAVLSKEQKKKRRMLG